MNNLLLVTILDGRDYLPELAPRHGLTHPPVLSNVICIHKKTELRRNTETYTTHQHKIINGEHTEERILLG